MQQNQNVQHPSLRMFSINPCPGIISDQKEKRIEKKKERKKKERKKERKKKEKRNLSKNT